MAKAALRPSDTNAPAASGKSILSFKDLAEYDDVLTDLLLDIPFLGMKTKKMNIQYHLDEDAAKAISAMTSPPRSRESSCHHLPAASVSSFMASNSSPRPLKDILNAKLIITPSKNTSTLLEPDDDQEDAAITIIEPSITKRSSLPYYTRLLAVRRNSVDLDAVAAVVVDLIYCGIRYDRSLDRTAAAILELVTNSPSDTLQDIFLPYSTALAGRTPKQLNDLKTHAKKYLQMYHPEAGYEVARTTRYIPATGKVEACVIATRKFVKGEVMNFCTGVFTAMTLEDEDYAKTRDFSIISLSSSKRDSLFLGPARFVNHDCEANMEFTFKGRGSLTFRVVQDINIGDEMTTFYSASYFGEANRECLCRSCEKNGRGFYARYGSNVLKPVAPQLSRQLPGRKAKVPTNYGPVSHSTPSREAEDNEEAEPFTTDYHTTFMEQGLCSICKSSLDDRKMEEFNNDPVAETLGRIPLGIRCGRCRRHYRLYGLEWPRRPSFHRAANHPVRARSPDSIRKSPPDAVLRPALPVKQVLEKETTKSPSPAPEPGDAILLPDTLEDYKDYCVIVAGVNASGEREMPGAMPTTFDRPHLVFVSPGSQRFPFWWPALIVPDCEEDLSMPKLPKTLGNDGVIHRVRYTETSHYGFVPQFDMRMFNPKTEPYISFAKHPAFPKDLGVINALEYLRKGRYPHKWKYFGDWKLPEHERRSETFQRKRRLSHRFGPDGASDVDSFTSEGRPSRRQTSELVASDLDHGRHREQPTSSLATQHSKACKPSKGKTKVAVSATDDTLKPVFVDGPQKMPVVVELDFEWESWLCRTDVELAFDLHQEKWQSYPRIPAYPLDNFQTARRTSDEDRLSSDESEEASSSPRLSKRNCFHYKSGHSRFFAPEDKGDGEYPQSSTNGNVGVDSITNISIITDAPMSSDSYNDETSNNAISNTTQRTINGTELIIIDDDDESSISAGHHTSVHSRVANPFDRLPDYGRVFDEDDENGYEQEHLPNGSSASTDGSPSQPTGGVPAKKIWSHNEISRQKSSSGSRRLSSQVPTVIDLVDGEDFLKRDPNATSSPSLAAVGSSRVKIHHAPTKRTLETVVISDDDDGGSEISRNRPPTASDSSYERHSSNNNIRLHEPIDIIGSRNLGGDSLSRKRRRMDAATKIL
ncbi:hypothetical protein SeMB42_g04086 [Synchytrium endobioticum]|uniref:SET domain-containing protein n=1 Tax=Synchytrium endobioticum TaxID=286115 RepID=A0A507CYD2_9FUNG|nr:hypothetical protein SeLEV6574_g04682 [Synchytrium endobioticum]TPX45204.1 hypothetical protein SeMB42_g04086 [Synchytrium endobioticum]